jgi:RNA polymerase primary sigma factor
VEHFDKELRDLIATGKSQGYLTYDEVNRYLPDEGIHPEKLDNLLIALEEKGIELVDQAPAKTSDDDFCPDPTAEELEQIVEEDPLPLTAADLPKLTDDPIRMYLSQMAAIPLLSREEEVALAKKIEITRKRFRRSVLTCDYALRTTVDTLRKVHQGQLPFDRTIKVSLTERLTKEQIQARMPHN